MIQKKTIQTTEPIRRLEFRQVYDKKTRSFATLDAFECMVYCVHELETYSAMEGWDAFFMGSRAHLYPAVRDTLARIGDTSSLLVLDDYERHLAAHGVRFEPRAIERFVAREEAEDKFASLDWAALFGRVEPERWSLLQSYLESHGVELVGRTERPLGSVEQPASLPNEREQDRRDGFVEHVLRRGLAWAVEVEDGLRCRASRYDDTKRVLLIWSSERAARRAAGLEPAEAQPCSVLLRELLRRWLPAMAADGLLVGPDPDGRLEPEEVGPIELRDRVVSQMDEASRALYEQR
jgi:hypothetical protein